MPLPHINEYAKYKQRGSHQTNWKTNYQPRNARKRDREGCRKYGQKNTVSMYVNEKKMKREWRPFCVVEVFFSCMWCGFLHKASVKNQIRMNQTNNRTGKGKNNSLFNLRTNISMAQGEKSLVVFQNSQPFMSMGAPYIYAYFICKHNHNNKMRAKWKQNKMNHNRGRCKVMANYSNLPQQATQVLFPHFIQTSKPQTPKSYMLELANGM